MAGQGKVLRVGVSLIDAPVYREALAGLQNGLRDLGYREGLNLAIEVRHPTDGSAGAKELAIADLRAANVDVIVTTAPPQLIPKLIRLASPTPIVEALMSSSIIGTSEVASYARPGGSLTGIIRSEPRQYARRLQLLHEVAPAVSHVAFVVAWDSSPNPPGLAETQAIAQTLGLDVRVVQPSAADNLKPALIAALPARTDGMMQYGADAFADPERQKQIIDSAATLRIPAVYDDREWAAAGGLMAYGPNIVANFRRAAAYVDKIAKGARAGDLPVEEPAQFDVVLNLRTARVLGLPIPPTVLGQASELIQ